MKVMVSMDGCKRLGKVAPDAMGCLSPLKPVGCLYLDVSPKIFDAEEPDRTALFKRQSRCSS